MHRKTTTTNQNTQQPTQLHTLSSEFKQDLIIAVNPNHQFGRNREKKGLRRELPSYGMNTCLSDHGDYSLVRD
jgi:hypothetical protein